MEDDGTNKGFGFANFPDPEHAAKAVEKFNNMETDGQTMYVTRAMKKAEREKFLKEKWEKAKAERQKKFAGVNLYVKYLDDSIDDERLKQEFSKFGNITSAKVMRDANNRSRGFGFVCFEKSEQSTIAMAEMNNKIVAGKPLYVALAQRKDVRRATLEKERGLGGGRGGERRDPKNPGGPAGRGPGGPGGRGRGMGRQMKNPMGYGPQNFNPMYGGRGFNPQQMAMYGPGRQAPMQQGWNPNMRQPMMPGGFRAPMPPYNSMMGMPRTAPAPKDFGANQANRGAARPAGGAPARQAPPAAAPVPVPAQRGPAAPAGSRDTSVPLTSEMLAQANPSQQKQMIGERIFPKIQHREPKLAGKITGMLLEMDNMELLHLLENEDALMLKINEALAVLNSHSNDGAEAAAE